MESELIFKLILQYRYWILIPLSLVEGPVVAFFSGTLSSFGYFNLPLLAAIFFIRDITLDILYYILGFYGANKRFAHRALRRLGLTEEHFTHIRALWDKHPFRTMFVGKVAYGIATAFIVFAGTVKISFWKFLKYGSLAAIAQYWTLLAAGYWLGDSFHDIAVAVLRTFEFAFLGIAIGITAYYIISFRMRKTFLREERQEEEEEKAKR